MTADRSVRTAGWGPFRLPGERRRWDAARRAAQMVLGTAPGGHSPPVVTPRSEGISRPTAPGVKIEELRSALIASREIARSPDTRLAVVSAVDAANSVVPGRVALWLLDDEARWLRLVHDSTLESAPDRESYCAIGSGVVGRAARYNQIGRGDPDQGEGRVYAFPLVVGARIIGVLECDADEEIEGSRLSMIELVATLAGSAVEASRLQAITERLAQVDPLTQLPDQRRLAADLDDAAVFAGRHGHAVSLVLLDLDRFKSINDHYGHQQGDVVLQDVASTLRAVLSEGETAYRYSGEEFAVLIRNGGSDRAVTLAERLRERIETQFHHGNRQLTTASLGVASLPEDADDVELLVRHADRALYDAKEGGRNRVRRAGASTAEGDRPDDAAR